MGTDIDADIIFAVATRKAGRRYVCLRDKANLRRRAP
jgi:hypothetical protein